MTKYLKKHQIAGPTLSPGLLQHTGCRRAQTGGRPMKVYNKIVMFVGLFIASGQAMDDFRIKPSEIRPVEIIVVDAETKEPVPEVTLCYNVVSGYWGSLLGIPNPWSGGRRDLLLEKYKTDSAGRASIPARRVWIKPFYEVVDHVDFYINFDIRDERSKKRTTEKFRKAVSTLICDEDDANIPSNDRYKTSVLYGFFFEDNEVVADSPIKENLINNPDETLVYRRESINYGPRHEKSKKTIVIELPLKKLNAPTN